ncbi:hypothetical protein [Pseudonocardia sp. GCM10023141]|uniref:hypothetical protein n=1 Tax=Pseudonocardia sp. GCM10023141 TaxID=3252653 RepID=UPI0036240E8D
MNNLAGSGSSSENPARASTWDQHPLIARRRAGTAGAPAAGSPDAAAVAEFETDPQAVKAIVAAAKSGQFDHTVQRLRDGRADAAAQEAVRAELVETGVEVIEREEMAWPMGWLDNHHLDPVKHVSCPGHAAYVSTIWSSERQGQTFAAIFVCRDVVAHGHVDPPAASGGAGARSRMSEQDKAERKVVIERNRQWVSATTVRRDWLRSFVARKSAPVGAERFIATWLFSTDHTIRQALEAIGHCCASCSTTDRPRPRCMARAASNSR